MGLGSQNLKELTGYIEEAFSEYMTFPTILFIVAIVVALSSIACFILAPFYIKGKAGGAKTAAQVISVIDFIVGILLIFAFLIITLLLNIASDGFFDSADGFLKVVLGFLIVPTRFGMSLEAVFGADANIGTPILFYALYFVTAGLLGLAAFIVSCIARGKYNAANGLIRGAAAPAGAPQYNPYQPTVSRIFRRAILSSISRIFRRATPSSISRIYRRVILSSISSLLRRIYRRTTHSISLQRRKFRRIYRRTMHNISLLSRKLRRIYRRTMHNISLLSRKFRRIYRRIMHSISLPSRMHRRIYRRKMQIQKFPCRRPWHKRLRYSRLRRHSAATVALR